MERNMYKKIILGIFLLVATGIFVNSSQLHAADQKKVLGFLEKQEELYRFLNLEPGISKQDIERAKDQWLRSSDTKGGYDAAKQEEITKKLKAFTELINNYEKYLIGREKVAVEWSGISDRFAPGTTLGEVKNFFVTQANLVDENKSRLSVPLAYKTDYMEATVNGSEECNDEYKLMKGDVVEIKYGQTIGKMASSFCGKIRSAVPMPELPSLPWKK